MESNIPRSNLFWRRGKIHLPQGERRWNERIKISSTDRDTNLQRHHSRDCTSMHVILKRKFRNLLIAVDIVPGSLSSVFYSPRRHRRFYHSGNALLFAVSLCTVDSRQDDVMPRCYTIMKAVQAYHCARLLCGSLYVNGIYGTGERACNFTRNPSAVCHLLSQRYSWIKTGTRLLRE